MSDRPVPEILEEWRGLERELYGCSSGEARIDLDRRIAAVQDEYRAALEHQDADARALGHDTYLAFSES